MNSRHRVGREPGEQEYPVIYDTEERRIARRIERDHPNWHVEWGVGSRCFHAYPRFHVPSGTRADSPHVRELVALMRDIEQRTWAPGPFRREGPPQAQSKYSEVP